MREMAGVFFSPWLFAFLLLTLLGVGVASAGSEQVVAHGGLDWTAMLSTIVGGLIGGAATMTATAWRMGRWIERKTAEIEDAHAEARRAKDRADSAHKLAGQALDEGRDHVADHARGAFR